MKITLNGEKISINNDIVLLKLLELKNIDQNNIAIEVNRKISKRKNYYSHKN